MGDDIGLTHARARYSMLNLVVKDVVPTVPYAFAMETMGDRIRRLRQARGLTQQELGDRVGVSKSAVSQWEGGSSKNLKLQTFLKVLEVLVTDANYLIYGESRGPSGGSSATGKHRALRKPPSES